MLTCNKIVEKSNKPKEGREAWTMSAIVIDVHGYFTSTAFDLRSWSVGKLPKKPKTKQKPNVRHHGWWKQSLVWLHVCPPPPWHSVMWEKGPEAEWSNSSEQQEARQRWGWLRGIWAKDTRALQSLAAALGADVRTSCDAATGRWSDKCHMTDATCV